MRRTRLALLTTTVSATITACYSPVVSDQTGMSGSETDAPSTGAMTEGGETENPSTTEDPTTGVDPDTTVGTTDTDPTSGDAPPVFESFTVNGSTAPAEVAEGGTITLEADVTDDVGVASVEFFDGATSLGIVTESPFELDVPVSSADSGSHTYTAVATDTADQMTTSEEVTLSVNIVGGEVLFKREGLFDGTTGLSGPGVGIGTSGDGRVVINGVVAGTMTGRVIGFNQDLSTLWSANTSGLTLAPVAQSGSDILVTSWVDGTWSYETWTSGSATVVETLDVAVAAGDIVTQLLGPAGIEGGSGFVLRTAPNRITSYATDLTGPDWQVDFPAGSIVGPLDTFGDGSVLISMGVDNQTNLECSSGFEFCLRRLAPDGSTTWTEGFDRTSSAAVTPAGGVVVLAANPATGFAVTLLDDAGTPTGPAQILDDQREYHEIAGVEGGPSGGFVMAGSVVISGDREALVSRYDSDFDLVWDQTALGNQESSSTGVTILGDAVFVVGLESLTIEPFAANGEVFAAKLRL